MKATLRSEASAGVRAETPQDSSSLTSGARIGRRYHIWSSLSAWLMFCWALIELPVELWVSTTWREAMALSCAKLLLFAVALEMARGAAWATAAFVGICATSVLAITPMLPTEFHFSPVGATLSTGEVLIKLFALLIVVLGPSMRGRLARRSAILARRLPTGARLNRACGVRIHAMRKRAGVRKF